MMDNFEAEMEAMGKKMRKKITKAHPKTKPRKKSEKEMKDHKWARSERKRLQKMAENRGKQRRKRVK